MSEIKHCDDGTYRWVYEFNMLKNPIIILTIWKIFVLILLGMWIVFGLFGIKTHGVSDAYLFEAKALMIPALILLGLSILAYFILAAMYGWKYCVLFEMNEDGIKHIHMEKQYKKAEALGWLTFMVGVVGGNPSTAGTGLLSATKNLQITEFSKVKKMKVLKVFNTIKLDSLLNHNQIYVEPEDFEFVKDYIEKRVQTK